MTIVGAKPPPERRFLGQLGTQRLPQLERAGISAGQKSVANRELGACQPNTPTNVKNDFDIQKMRYSGVRCGATGHDKDLGIDVSLPVAGRKAVQQRATRTLSHARRGGRCEGPRLCETTSRSEDSPLCATRGPGEDLQLCALKAWRRVAYARQRIAANTGEEPRRCAARLFAAKVTRERSCRSCRRGCRPRRCGTPRSRRRPRAGSRDRR